MKMGLLRHLHIGVLWRPRLGMAMPARWKRNLMSWTTTTDSQITAIHAALLPTVPDGSCFITATGTLSGAASGCRKSPTVVFTGWYLA